MPHRSTSKFISVVGLIVSAYAVYVEHAAEVARANNESYSALCDISDSVACSTVFLSPYGRALAYFGVVKQGSAYDIPNGVMGIAFYIVMLILDSVPSIPYRDLLKIAGCSISVAFSCWLAYVLLFVLKGMCLVCTSAYFLNVVLLYVSIQQLRAGPAPKPKAA